MNKLPGLCLCAAYLLVGAFCIGCDSHDGRRYSYLLDVDRQGARLSLGSGKTVTVHGFAVSPRFKDKALVYRTDQLRYESDYYNEFLTWPGELITEQVREWLERTGLFGHVLKPGDAPESAYFLKGNVKALYGDFTGKAEPKAVMAVQFLLIEVSEDRHEIVYDKTHEASASVESKSAEKLVEGYSECLGQILTGLEQDLKKVVAE